MLKEKEAFLALVKLGIGNAATAMLPDRIDWDSVETLAEKQGLLGVVYDGVIRLADSTENAEIIPLGVKLRWMGKVLQGYEKRYTLYKKAVADLGTWYRDHGYRMMSLKGLACGLDWPRPEHRPYGDIDIWLFGEQKSADAALLNQYDNKIEIDNSHHHHSVFQWEGFAVENHYDFLNVHHHKSNKGFEKILKGLVNLKSDDCSNSNLTDDTNGRTSHPTDEGLLLPSYICLPPANFNALFLLHHSMAHFAAEQITIRHLLDWAFFVEKHGKEVDWKYVLGVLDQFGMRTMFNIFNAICVGNLGFSSLVFGVECSESVDCTELGELKERVLNEIISPEFAGKLPSGLLKRVFFKTRRWIANEWKHRLCYKESMWSAFWSGVWNHLLKPSSI